VLGALDGMSRAPITLVCNEENKKKIMSSSM
jgi:hypothetical protein